MIRKERKIPISLLKYEALLRRIQPSHPKRAKIEEEYAKSRAGYYGEQSLDYYLKTLHDKKYYIFHDLRLSVNSSFFQIDSLLISQQFILVIEMKNISGTIYFDDKFKQLVRTINGKEEGFPDPILQAERHKSMLFDWIKFHKIPCPPIEYLIVISKPSTIIKTPPSNRNLPHKVIHNANLPSMIKEFERKNVFEKLSIKEMRKLSNLLIKKDSPYSQDILKKFNIHESELIRGVHCRHCNYLPMTRTYSSWKCVNCSFSSRSAFIPSLTDFALLCSSTIKNKEMREFLQLSSRSSVMNLLKSLNLEHRGTTKGRVYDLKQLIEKLQNEKGFDINI
ncbi:nuclease-related domain-containing protein [Metabacillus arenae]|uniref:NERD domain-containing protein n=1 Tax=Metabacillus arenae TaxID=2771434 RepID=A0A926NJM1_9BACI|nr:nuclease-related domain-containing protein [Metabacillus arenae]MBD1382556.1 NERD domain-containing protein [Metabacillus arenae]